MYVPKWLANIFSSTTGEICSAFKWHNIIVWNWQQVSTNLTEKCKQYDSKNTKFERAIHRREYIEISLNCW